MEAQVVVDEWRRIVLDRSPLQGLLDGAPAVQPRPDATPPGALADDLLVLDRGAGLGPQIGKLELVAQPVDDVVDLELEQQLEIAALVAAFAFAAATVHARIGRTQRVARFRA